LGEYQGGSGQVENEWALASELEEDERASWKLNTDDYHHMLGFLHVKRPTNCER